MRKQKLTKKVFAGQQDVGHLEETLTDITTTTARSLKRFKKPILLVFSVIAGVIVVYSLIRAFESGRADELNARFYRLFALPVSREEEPDLKEVDNLIGEVQSREGEAYMASQVVSYLLQQADKIEDRKRQEEAAAKKAEEAGTTSESVTGEETAPAAVPEKTVPEKKAETVCGMTPEAARNQALALARKTAEHYPQDRHLQNLASEVKEKVEGATKTGWLPAALKYRLAPPPTGAHPEAKSAAETAPDPAASGTSPQNEEGEASPGTGAGEASGEAKGAPAEEPAKTAEEPAKTADS